MNPRVTIVVPCFGRPARTRRIINNILAQSINNWEAFIIGDGCPQFQSMVDSLEVDYFQKVAKERGNTLHCYNLKKNTGGFGAKIVDYAIEHAKGEFFIFAGNDDLLLPTHFENYLSEIEGTDLDLVYYNTYIAPNSTVRDAELLPGRIGHSELIIRTECIRDIRHNSNYGHDYDFIQEVLKKAVKVKKAQTDNTTYVITHIHHFGTDITCDNID